MNFLYFSHKNRQPTNHTCSSFVHFLSQSPLNCFEQTINLGKKTLFHVHREPFSTSLVRWNNLYKFKTACSFDCIKRESWHLNRVCTQKLYLSSQQPLGIYSLHEQERLNFKKEKYFDIFFLKYLKDPPPFYLNVKLLNMKVA